MQILTIRELFAFADSRSQADFPLLLTDNSEVFAYPRIVDVSFRFGKVVISMRTCVMADDFFNFEPQESLSPRELLRYAAQYGFADKPLLLSDSSGLGYYVVDSSLSVELGRCCVDISVCPSCQY